MEAREGVAGLDARGVKVGEAQVDPKPLSFSLFLLFYHPFILSRYKKFRAVLAMERTKHISQNKQQKEPDSLSSMLTEIYFRLKPLAGYSQGNLNVRKNNIKTIFRVYCKRIQKYMVK